MKVIKQLVIKDRNIDFVILNCRDESEMKSFYELFILCFGERNNLNQETFKWFNIENPSYDNILFAFIDVEKAKMVSAYGFLPGNATINGQIRNYVLANNVMTHPEYAGQGIFKLIGKEALGFLQKIGYSFVFGVPNEKAIRGHLRVGWEIINELYFYEYNINHTNNPSFKESNKENIFFENRNTLYSDGLFMDMFIDKYNFYFNRTAKWLKWRLNKPLSEYLVHTLPGEKPFSFIIIKKFTDHKTGIKKIHIVDFGYDNIESFKNLISHSQIYAENIGFDLVNIWQYPFNNTEVQALGKLGFIKTTSSNPIIIHKLGNEIDLPLDKWHITLFDNDVF